VESLPRYIFSSLTVVGLEWLVGWAKPLAGPWHGPSILRHGPEKYSYSIGP